MSRQKDKEAVCNKQFTTNFFFVFFLISSIVQFQLTQTGSWVRKNPFPYRAAP